MAEGTQGIGGDSHNANTAIITARGTGDGLVVRIDSRVAGGSVIPAVKEFFASRKTFLSGNSVSLEWVGGMPQASLAEEITTILSTDFGIEVRSSKQRTSNSIRDILDGADNKTKRGGLFSGVVADNVTAGVTNMFDMQGSAAGQNGEIAQQKSEYDLTSLGAYDEANAKVVYMTLRSGQRIESEHTVIVIGDVNPGAEIVSGGDIIVLGSLRGTAHAGAYDESGGGKIIFAQNMQPTQLRIGVVISRGSKATLAVAGVARVDGDMIVAEPFNSKATWLEKRSVSKV